LFIGLLAACAGVAACSSSSSPPAAGSGGAGGTGGGTGGTNGTLDQHTMDLLNKAMGVTKPIADVHVHLFQPSRSGVAWPASTNTVLFKDYLPPTYMGIAQPLGILGSGIVEASPWNDDTQWLLGQVAATPATQAFFPWYVAQLDITSADFITNLTAYLKVDPMTNPNADKIVGLRVYLWSGTIDLTNAIQMANLAEVQKQGLTLEIISRVSRPVGQPPAETNPKAQVVALATMFPNIRIIIDHMAGAKIAAAMPDPNWMADITSLAAKPNIYIKWSAFFDSANASGDESMPWTAPKDMMSYKAIFDALFMAFGPDRMIWGSNYPVSELGGTQGMPLGNSIKEELTIAEAYLATQPTGVRDKVMFDNAILFYRRLPPGTPATTLSPTTMALQALKTGKTLPIMDTHVHEFQPSRPGVVWPASTNATLYKDYLPKTCTMAAGAKATCGPAYADEIAGQNVILSNVVEASPRNNDATGNYDTDWVLSQIKGNDQFFNYAAELDITSKDFIRNLDLNTSGMTADGIDRSKMISGLRVYLWSGTIDLTDATQMANLAEVQKRGMTLDIISRVSRPAGQPPAETNPKAQVVALAKAFPKIRIIIDHMAGAKIDAAMPVPTWVADITSLAAQPNIYIKWSAFFDAANATGDESMPWVAPKDMMSYKGVFDALWAAFGEDRLIWGSNWPVVKLAGTVAEEVKIAEDYLATKTPAQRDKVMFKNAILFYRRVLPQ
jgi:predicted TIM-barrel fold metal-dependent hydrolase